MNTENVHVLTDRIPRQDSSKHAKALQYLNAAHVKLKKLQAWRQQQKLDFAACIFERDTALREVEKLKFTIDEKSCKLEQARNLIELQARFIKELQDERSISWRNDKIPRPVQPGGSEAPALTVRAVEKFAVRANDKENTADTVNQGLSAGAIVVAIRGIWRRMIPD